MNFFRAKREPYRTYYIIYVILLYYCIYLYHIKYKYIYIIYIFILLSIFKREYGILQRVKNPKVYGFPTKNRP